MDKELEPVINSDPEINISFDSQDSAVYEFTSDFTAGEARAKASAAQAGKLLGIYPKALLYTVLTMLPTLLIYALGVFKFSASSTAGTAIEIIALAVPILFGGPLYMGFCAGIMDVERGNKFDVKRLFFAFHDNYFIKAVFAFIITGLLSAIASIICQIPAIAVNALSANLEMGFAYVATNVLIIILLIIGVVLSTQIIFRFALVFPLLIDNPDMRIMEAIKLSVSAMKGNCWKLFCLLISYIGWYVLSFAVATAVAFAAAYIGYSYITALSSVQDFLTVYMYLMIGIVLFYALAYILIMLALSTVIARPVMGLAAFYDLMTGYTPEPEPEHAPTPEPSPEPDEGDTDMGDVLHDNILQDDESPDEKTDTIN